MKNNKNIIAEDILWKLEDISMPGINGPRLENISLSIKPGITAVLGPSGAGKSSLLNLLVEFEIPSHGELKVSDKTTPFFWVPQNLGLWPHMKVGEHLDVMISKTEKKRTEEMLERLEMLDKKNVFPSQLSQGEKSRLAMARALIASPAVLVMDEPLINIDPAKQLFFWDLVIDIAEKKNISLVYATHSPKHVIGTAGNVICMKDAEVIYSGKVDELYHSPPSFELAEYLGDINWIEEVDKSILSEGLDLSFPLKLRPEQLSLKNSQTGPLKVVKSIFRGEIARTMVEIKTSGKTLDIYHRPHRNPDPGESVEIDLEI